MSAEREAKRERERGALLAAMAHGGKENGGDVASVKWQNGTLGTR